MHWGISCAKSWDGIYLSLFNASDFCENITGESKHCIYLGKLVLIGKHHLRGRKSPHRCMTSILSTCFQAEDVELLIFGTWCFSASTSPTCLHVYYKLCIRWFYTLGIMHFLDVCNDILATFRKHTMPFLRKLDFYRIPISYYVRWFQKLYKYWYLVIHSNFWKCGLCRKFFHQI